MKISAFGFYKLKRLIQLIIILPLVIISLVEFVLYSFNGFENDWMYLPLILFFAIYGLLRLINGLISLATKQYYATKTKITLKDIDEVKNKTRKNYLEFRGKQAVVFSILDIAISMICFGAMIIILRYLF